MKTLTLKNRCQTNATLLPNDFIDNYMVNANGEFVKVYLFLSSLTISMIADCLNNTENDILRAFRYWETEGLLRLEKDADGRIAGIELQKTGLSQNAAKTSGAPAQAPVQSPAPLREAQSSAPEPPVSTAKAVPIDTFRAQKELKSLLFIAEQYLGKTLTRTDVDAITYFYDTLHMSADLIEYLIETCVENGHKSMHYIQKVALSWADSGIETVSQAREQSASYNRRRTTALLQRSSRRPAAGRSLPLISPALNTRIRS